MNNIITLVGADARFTASIAQLLKFKTKGQYTLGSGGGITLVDADSIDGRRAIEKHLDDTTIILTVSPENYDHALVLRKPFKVEELLSLIDSLEGAAAKLNVENSKPEEEIQPTSGNPFAKFLDPEYLENKKKQGQERAQETNNISDEILEQIADESIEHKDASSLSVNITFAELKDKLLELSNIKPYKYDHNFLGSGDNNQLYEMFNLYLQTDDVYFDMLDYATVQLCNDICLNKFANSLVYVECYNGIIILFDDGVLLSNLSGQSLLDFLEMKKNQISVQIIESEEQIVELLNRFDEFYYDDALAFLSRSVLQISKGRIINKKGLTDPLGLMKHKGSIKFPVAIPHAQEFDSIWEFRNVSLRDTADLLPEVNPYYIFSYYTLCCLYGFLGTDVVETKSKDHLDLNALLTELKNL